MIYQIWLMTVIKTTSQNCFSYCDMGCVCMGCGHVVVQLIYAKLKIPRQFQRLILQYGFTSTKYTYFCILPKRYLSINFNYWMCFKTVCISTSNSVSSFQVKERDTEQLWLINTHLQFIFLCYIWSSFKYLSRISFQH